jgi:hypothetical protein
VVLTEVLLVPVALPGIAPTELPYKVLNPYSKVTVVVKLFAFTVPLNVADVFVIPLAAFVVVVAVVQFVEKGSSFPYEVPAPLVA